MLLTNRSNQLEIIDLGDYEEQEYKDCLYQLSRVGRLLGGDRATYWGFNQLKTQPFSILDVGCGGGLFTIELAKKYPMAHVQGIDLSAKAIQYANHYIHHQSLNLPNLQFSVPASSQLNYPPNSFDVVTSTLVCHHLTDDELIQFFKQSYLIANQAVIFNDLHRHWMASLSFSLISPLLFHNHLITHDGLLSIKRSFKRQEWIRLLQAAHIPLHRCSITWHPFFRWIVILYPEAYEEKK